MMFSQRPYEYSDVSSLTGYPREEMASRRGDSRLIKNTKEKGRGQQVKLENKSPVSEQQI